MGQLDEHFGNEFQTVEHLRFVTSSIVSLLFGDTFGSLCDAIVSPRLEHVDDKK